MLKIRPYILLLGFVLIVSACAKKREVKAIHFLTGADAKYWTEVKRYPVRKYAGLKFNANGRCDEYVLDYKAGTRIKIARPGILPAWRLVNDSTLFIGSLGNVRIEYLDEDVMVLNQMQQKWVIVYLKAKDQKTELVKDTSDHSMDM
jgi:hypothetical protein